MSYTGKTSYEIWSVDLQDKVVQVCDMVALLYEDIDTVENAEEIAEKLAAENPSIQYAIMEVRPVALFVADGVRCINL